LGFLWKADSLVPKLAIGLAMVLVPEQVMLRAKELGMQLQCRLWLGSLLAEKLVCLASELGLKALVTETLLGSE
jgi:hypothetical protein